MSIAPKPTNTTAGYIHLLFKLSVFFESINSKAGRAIKKAISLILLNSSLNNNQAAITGIKRERRCAASVFTIPMCLMEAAKNKNMVGNKIPSGI